MAEEITFSGLWHKDLQPMEWLQYIADSFSGLADVWDEYDSDYFEDEFEEYKVERPDIGKVEMYEEISQGVGECLLHAYIYDSMDAAKEMEYVRENIIKAFGHSIIFPNLLNAIGIIESVMSEAKPFENSFYYYQYYSVVSTPEEAREWFGEEAVKRYKKNPKLTEDDYENAFNCITELLEIIEKNQFSAKLRESAWAIKGYCKLNAESPEKYAEIEAEIAKTKDNHGEIPQERKSPPLSLSRMAEYWGGEMTATKLKSLIARGNIKAIQLNRQTYIFDTEHLPATAIVKIKR
jgi:hypothetical protein